MALTDRSPELMLGTLAMKAGYVTRKQLDECLREQLVARQKGQTLPLGQILVAKGYMKAKNLAFLLQNHAYVEQRVEDKLFGQIAVANGLLSQKDLDHCLDAQRDTYFDRKQVKRIGEILKEAGVLSAQEVEAVAAAQARIRSGAKAPGPSRIEEPEASRAVASAPTEAMPVTDTTVVRPSRGQPAPAPEITWETADRPVPKVEPPASPPPTTRRRPPSTKLRRSGPDPTRRK